MFRWLNNQGVESNKGFVVQSMSRFTIEYRESSNIIVASVERGVMENGKACIYIYPSEFKAWVNGSSIPKEKQQQIIKNFIEAMNFQGVEVLFAE